MEKLVVKAPAKINLYLRVLGKRPDNFHEIESLIQAIDLYDEITLEKADHLDIICSDLSIPSDYTNLAYRAAKLLYENKYIPGAKITLLKNIPSGAGLGGGSSDAAFVLRGLCSLYSIALGYNQMLELAGRLGSDVPFFLTCGQALARGRGELLEEIDLSLNYTILLLSPSLHVSTADVYRAVKNNLTKRSAEALLSNRKYLSGFIDISQRFHNDLEDIVLAKYPFLDELKRSLLGAGAFYSSMTGSGSSFFGLFKSDVAIPNELENLKEYGIRFFKCRPILLPPLLG